MRIRWCFLCLFCLSSSLHSAGPVLHLWVAERFCKICGITDNDILQGIIVGTEFPDIRYLTHELRNLTHPLVSDISEILQSQTPFEVGMKLHAWLDVIRENFIEPEVYAAITRYAEGHSAALLKFIEEEMLGDIYDGRQCLFYFDKVLPEEIIFTDEKTIHKWHAMIQWTISIRPSWLLWAQSYRGSAFGISTNTLYNWSYLLPELKQEPIFKNHLNTLLEYIEMELRLAFQSN